MWVISVASNERSQKRRPTCADRTPLLFTLIYSCGREQKSVGGSQDTGCIARILPTGDIRRPLIRQGVNISESIICDTLVACPGTEDEACSRYIHARRSVRSAEILLQQHNS